VRKTRREIIKWNEERRLQQTAPDRRFTKQGIRNKCLGGEKTQTYPARGGEGNRTLLGLLISLEYRAQTRYCYQEEWMRNHGSIRDVKHVTAVLHEGKRQTGTG